MLQVFAIAFSACLALTPGAGQDEPPLAPAEIHALLTSPQRHVRVLDPELRETFEAGVYQSPTLAHLLAAIERTDVIVQVVRAVHLPLSTPARLLLVPMPKAFRFLRIQVRVEGSDTDLVELLGHELQHAREIGEAPQVRNDETLIALYRRIGFAGRTEHEFDTDAALATGRRIRRELYDAAIAANAAEEAPLARVPRREPRDSSRNF